MSGVGGLAGVVAAVVGEWTSPDDYGWAAKMTAAIESAVLDHLRAVAADEGTRARAIDEICAASGYSDGVVAEGLAPDFADAALTAFLNVLGADQ